MSCELLLGTCNDDISQYVTCTIVSVETLNADPFPVGRSSASRACLSSLPACSYSSLTGVVGAVFAV